MMPNRLHLITTLLTTLGFGILTPPPGPTMHQSTLRHTFFIVKLPLEHMELFTLHPCLGIIPHNSQPPIPNPQRHPHKWSRINSYPSNVDVPVCTPPPRRAGAVRHSTLILTCRNHPQAAAKEAGSIHVSPDMIYCGEKNLWLVSFYWCERIS